MASKKIVTVGEQIRRDCDRKIRAAEKALWAAREALYELQENHAFFTPEEHDLAAVKVRYILDARSRCSRALGVSLTPERARVAA
jgi:hypothetical protein